MVNQQSSDRILITDVADHRLTAAYQPRVLPVGWARSKTIDNAYRNIHSKITVMVSAARENDGRRWVHVSISHPDRLPTWYEMRDVKTWIIGADALAIQVLPRAAEYVNTHPNCLHLWQCLDGDPVPDFRRDGEV